jgi:hypothetical protein
LGAPSTHLIISVHTHLDVAAAGHKQHAAVWCAGDAPGEEAAVEGVGKVDQLVAAPACVGHERLGSSCAAPKQCQPVLCCYCSALTCTCSAHLRPTAARGGQRLL